jgi:hypothetical protein
MHLVLELARVVAQIHHDFLNLMFLERFKGVQMDGIK